MARTRFAPPTTRLASFALLTGAAALVLTGCAGPADPGAPTDGDETTSFPAPDEQQEQPQDEQPESEAEAPDPDQVQSEDVGLDCNGLITPDQMYEYPSGPNFALVEADDVDAQTRAAAIEEMDGLVCQWVNATSEETLDVALAMLADDEIEGLANLAQQQSRFVPTYQSSGADYGYFTVEDGVGEAQVFSGRYWLTLRSQALLEPGDAQPLVADVLGNLPS